jgi:hypothetical protein
VANEHLTREMERLDVALAAAPDKQAVAQPKVR